MPASFKGRYLGVLILVLAQFLVGAVHAVIGLGLIFGMPGEFGYSIYTFLYGIITVIFGYGIWGGRRSGWVGTIFVALFVIVVDVFTVLNVSLIAGVPRSAAFGEIFYSLVVLLYLLQPKIIHEFLNFRN
ncbi:MAG: hypothetical protein JSW14_01600 [Candidatus Bathyarchaeum sp.]|nr:MAG: hypothetical protein JSW14_01600 [Candidatus Bathyarchaeum sp.]